jgi:hypothetical protein
MLNVRTLHASDHRQLVRAQLLGLPAVTPIPQSQQIGHLIEAEA